jgi:hypothetical protein
MHLVDLFAGRVPRENLTERGGKSKARRDARRAMRDR